MAISKRNAAPTPAKVPAAKKPAAKNPIAPTPRRDVSAAAPKRPAKPTESPAPSIAAKIPPPPRNDEKRIRASFALPESHVALLGELKKRCQDAGVNVKKGELLNAGLQLLKNLPETALEAAVLPSIRLDRRPGMGKKRKKQSPR